MTPDLRAASATLLYGTEEPMPREIQLQAGPLQMRLRGTRLLAIVADGHEVWHGVGFLYRDRDWGTPEPIVDHTEHHPLSDGFRIRLQAHVPVEPVIDLVVEIQGHADGSLRYAGTAVARGDVATNRTGLCVMHPLESIGRPIEVEHVDGRTSVSTFPRLIAAWPPFMLVRGIQHVFGDGGRAACRFEGDAFEFEDQRNNADASFKTYSRSNMAPRPYRLRREEPVSQSVELRLLQRAKPAADHRKAPVLVRVDGPRRPLPPIGIGIDPSDAASAWALEPALRRLSPALLHLSLDSVQQTVDWQGIAALLAAAGAKLRLDVPGPDLHSDRTAFAALAGRLRKAGVQPESVAVIPGSPDALAAARNAFPTSAIGGGTPYFFTQLNRAEGIGPVDFLTFTTSALVHGAEEDVIMHGLESLPWMLETLAVTHPGLPVRIGPSAIAARSSPIGAQPDSDGQRRIPLAARDPRDRALFGAAWLLGYVSQLVGAGVETLTLRSLTGDRGLLATDLTPYPSFHLVALLGSPATCASVTVSDSRRVAALHLSRDERPLLLLANLTADRVDVDVPPGGEALLLDEAALRLPQAGWRPACDADCFNLLRLEPHGLALLRAGQPT
ncbi:MAG: hypothetical protein FJX31_07635 [Alphaproteobacteria bacterium]|nr:hypothetical protein [Alphaproteobacteria bacterium]